MKKIVVLGATGSIGSSTLAVLRAYPEEFEITGLAARRPGRELAALAAEFPRAAVAAAEADDAFRREILAMSPGRVCLAGPDAAERLVRDTPADICVVGTGGTAGLAPAFAAAETGRRVLLANKEVLVSAGRMFMDAARAGGSSVLPLDSEHAALWQCLEGRDMAGVDKLVVTASGGPFREWSRERIASATPADALRHPVWRMGAKISVDSASLANKALEVIEAHFLFGVPPDAIEVMVHPQSTVHGMVGFADGSLIAHMGICDMRQPIAAMLFYPEKRRTDLPRLDLTAIGRLDFEKPDPLRFPLLAIGLEAFRRGGGYPALFNAANEAAVELFLRGGLSFGDMAAAVEAALRLDGRGEFSRLDDVLETHKRARAAVREYAAGRAGDSIPETAGGAGPC